MQSPPRKMQLKFAVSAEKQRGFVLLLIMLTLLAIAGIVVLNGLGTGAAGSARLAQQIKSDGDFLQVVKQSLIGYTINPPVTIGDIRPGMMPIPDSLSNGSYDGLSDDKCLGSTPNGLPGVNSTSTSKRCLGKIPWKDLGLNLGNPLSNDPLGQVPWMAISANLVFYDNCLKVLNSDIANLASPATSTCSPGSWPYAQPTVLPHPWLSVYDQNGVLLSDKVAIVLIMPGQAIATETRNQTRTLMNPGYPSDYLDSINLPLGCTSVCTVVYDNAGLNNKFIAIPPGTRYPSNAANALVRGQLVPFNDTLIYVTIDELMYYVERRVLGEMANAMRNFKTGAGGTGFDTYPWLQPLSASWADSVSLYSQANTTFGAFPFMSDYSAVVSNPSYRTGFSWVVSSPTELPDPVTPCIQVNAQAGSNKWMKHPLVGALNSTNAFSAAGPFTSGVAATSEGTCQWLGGKKLSCVKEAGVFSKNMTLWSTQNRCETDSATTAGTLSVNLTRTISLYSKLCNPSAVTTTYSIANNVNLHRWNFACSSVRGEEAISIADTLTTVSAGFNKLPQTVTVASDSAATALPLRTLSVSDMSYQPIMPTWFHDNRWYTTAFAAIAPAAGNAPAIPLPNSCGAVMSLTFDTKSANAVVILSGRSLAGQTRPSSAVANYLEPANANAGSSCAMTNSGLPLSATFNDNILVVSP